MSAELCPTDVVGLIRPGVDAHTLGVSAIAALLRECGYTVVIGDAAVAAAVDEITKLNQVSLLCAWLRQHRITRLGFSYRLDPQQAQQLFGKVYHQLKERRLFHEDGGPIRALYFAGLPDACRRIREEYGHRVTTFMGDETPAQTLARLGVPDALIPNSVFAGAAYDDARMTFGRQLIESGRYHRLVPQDRSGYDGFGTARDTLAARVAHMRAHGQLPLTRAHVGPYNPNQNEAVLEFIDWVKQLAKTGFLDVVSIGTSQLTQSHFGRPWGDMPNGGGVPINSEEEYRRVWDAGRPMLFRTYAGTSNIPELARAHERTLHIAWHALSFWWFCQIDGRGPHTVRQNLAAHVETLRYIAETGKPFEPNIPHHFAFRGGDDVTYVVSAFLAAKTAKTLGVRRMVLQTMLNTPKYTWGVQDLAKARALLRLVRELEDASFQVYLQPRAGLDYFSPDLDKAKIQLAAVTALMDDIEPDNTLSPDIIHVVSYSEASHLADPTVIDESVKITNAALLEYRRRRAAGKVEHMGHNAEVLARTTALYDDAKPLINAIETHVPHCYSPLGLYLVFAAGFFATPYLWEGTEEFKHAVQWRTALKDGGIRVVDESDRPISASARCHIATSNLGALSPMQND